MSNLLYHLRRMAYAKQCSGLTDGELLEAFVARRDVACFETIVRRHGPMVLGVCRRVLRDSHDAEDAFQAAFLVFIRRAVAVPRQAVGNWLYGVAYRTALNARRTAARRRERERPEDVMPQAATIPDDSWAELRPVLDDELSRLPDKYRSAVVLCDVEGLTRAEAARQLGVPEGTVSGRLTTARRMLATRLAKRGVTLSAGALAIVLSQGVATAAVSPPLLAAAVELAEASVIGVEAGVVSAQVAALADSVVSGLTAVHGRSVLVALFVVPCLAAAVTIFPGRRTETPPAHAHEEAANAAAQIAPFDAHSAESSDKAKLQGTWTAVSAEVNGKSAAGSKLAALQFVFAGDNVIHKAGEKISKGTYHLDTTQTPRHLDLKLNDESGKELELRHVYEVTKDKLTLCWSKTGKRPGSLNTLKEQDCFLCVFAKQ